MTATASQSGLHKRFSNILSLEDFCWNGNRKALLAASVTHLYFDLRWLQTALNLSNLQL